MLERVAPPICAALNVIVFSHKAECFDGAAGGNLIGRGGVCGVQVGRCGIVGASSGGPGRCFWVMQARVEVLVSDTEDLLQVAGIQCSVFGARSRQGPSHHWRSRRRPFTCIRESYVNGNNAICPDALIHPSPSADSLQPRR